jgi:hypothetical protein
MKVGHARNFPQHDYRLYIFIQICQQTQKYMILYCNILLHFSLSINTSSSAVSCTTLMFCKTYLKLFTLKFYTICFDQCGHHQVLNVLPRKLLSSVIDV